MKYPLVTIGVTCYNNERYINTCIDSILNQTYQNVEIIVVDDYSIDNSIFILQQYKNRIRLIQHEKNSGGLLQGRRDVISAASGEFIHHLDADDFLQPEFVSRMVDECLSDPQLDWVAGNVNVVDIDGKLVDQWDYKGFPSDPVQGLFRGYHTTSVPVPKNGIFKLSFIRDYKLSWYQLPHTTQGEDAYTCIKYLECNPKIKLIPDFLMNLRVHFQNMSANVLERIKMVIDLKEYYINHFNEMVYLFNPKLLRLVYNSDEYLALKYYTIAKDFLNAKENFGIPPYFKSEETENEINNNLWLFDDPIRKYAELSLRYSDSYSDELKLILAKTGENTMDVSNVVSSLITEGQRRLTEGDFNMARTSFETALNESSDSVEALRGLGEVFYALNDKKEAETHFASALELNPEDPQTLNNVGVIFHDRKEYTNAEAVFLKALSIDAHSAETYFNLCDLWGTTWSTTPPEPRRKQNLLDAVGFISDNSSDSSRDTLLQENIKLRDTLLQEYHCAYQQTSKKVLLHCPGNGAIKYLMTSWSDILNYMGIKTELVNWGEETRTKFESCEPDVFITVADPSYISQIDVDYIKRYKRERRLLIGHIITADLYQYKPCDFCITFHLDPERDPVMSKVNMPLLSLPFAINPLKHFMRQGTEIWDYFFVGTNSPFKVKETKTYLMPIVNNYRGIIAGVNWETGIGELSIGEAAQLYNYARIYPNYHVSRQMEEYNEINERTYIIPASGGFELVDNPVAIQEIFATDEMAIASSPEEYHDMFDYFLRNPDKRISYIEKGMRRVWNQYTLFHVLSKLADFLDIPRAQTSPLSKTS
ncbi:MAG: glycosyltransferase [Candidatus Scalindua sp.]|jgi:glycosyltransferase involved in cell wall biosynthesis|nr:glycosyltransferase [Candidatus Scalindua sp.]